MPNKYMETAIDEALLSGRDVPVGAVIVKGNKIIAKAHNRKEELKDVSAHAEILALKVAADVIGDWRLTDCEMYVTLEPCPMCASAIINSRIKKLYFGTADTLYGALGGATDLRKLFNSKLQVVGGIMEKECAELLKNFWRDNE